MAVMQMDRICVCALKRDRKRLLEFLQRQGSVEITKVDPDGLFSSADTAETYVIAQSIPGVIIVNFAVLSGLRLAGKRGACIAAGAVILPAFFIILALAILFRGRWDHRWVAAALNGLRPAVVAVVAGAALRLGRAHLRRVWLWLAAALAAGLMFFKLIGPVPLILLGATVGLLGHALSRRGSGS